LIGVVYARMTRDWSSRRIIKLNVALGVSFLLVFVGIRVNGGFGNLMFPDVGDGLGNPFLTSIVHFLNVVKYPPTLAYSTVSMGLNHLIIAGLYLIPPNANLCKHTITRFAWRLFCPILLDFGRSALFFFIIHTYVYQFLGVVSHWIPFYTAKHLGELYVMWLIGLLMLKPICVRYTRFKYQQPETSLWRLL